MERKSQIGVAKLLKNGGASRDRTDDLIVANDALSQLSYSPMQVGSVAQLFYQPSESAPSRRRNPFVLRTFQITLTKPSALRLTNNRQYRDPWGNFHV